MNDIKAAISEALARWHGDQNDRRRPEEAIYDAIGPEIEQIQKRIQWCRLLVSDYWTDVRIDASIKKREEEGLQ